MSYLPAPSYVSNSLIFIILHFCRCIDTTSSPSTYLLALPLELRDQIYEHVYQEIRLHWKWKITGTRRVVLPIHIEKAPLLSILLSCSRLHTEYCETSFVKNLAVILYWDTATTYTPKGVSSVRRADETLAVILTRTTIDLIELTRSNQNKQIQSSFLLTDKSDIGESGRRMDSYCERES
jgi:hypothetical protein